jgi:cobalt-zinc-cadmium efflux system membrane fusion protein
MNYAKLCLWVLGIGSCITLSCKSGTKTSDEEATVKQNGEVTLTLNQLKNGGIAFGQITRETLSLDIHAKGKLVLPPQNLAFVTTPIAGSVERVLVQEGKYVNRGASMLVLVSPELIRLQQEYISALGRFQLLEQDYERQQALAKDKITSDKRFQEVKADYFEIKSRVASIQMQLELINIPVDQVRMGNIQKSANITAPISGHVDKCMVHPGQFAEPNTPLMVLVDKSRLFIELMVFEKDVRYVAVGQRVTFELVNLGGEEFEARVQSIGTTVEEGARTVKVLAEFVNSAPSILPGMFAAAEIHTDEQELDALPEEAVIADDNESFCYYTQTPDGSGAIGFKKALLRTGFREDGFIQVEPLTAIPAGARIVVKGTYFIKAEGLKQAE